MPSSWVPLNVHSHYSILNAVGSPKQIVAKAVDFGIDALALTDRGNLFGAIEFYKACKSAKIKPIIGCEFCLAPSSRFEKSRISGKRSYFPIVLLAKDLTGYHNLCKLSSLGYLEGFYYYPRIDRELLEKYHDGLVCLSGSLGSAISELVLSDSSEDLQKEICWYRDLFGDDYYLQLQRHGMNEEHLKNMLDESWLYQGYQDYIAKQDQINKKFAEITSVKCVATNGSYYTDRKDWRSHEILCNVQVGETCVIWENGGYGSEKRRIPNPKRKVYFTHELYLKSPDEMAAIFFDNPEALQNTLEVAEKCSLEIDFKTKHYPVYVPPGLENEKLEPAEREKKAQDYLWKLCEEGIGKRYTEKRLAKIKELHPDKDPLDVVRERLNYEMSIIVPKELSDYLLIVYDFIHWAREREIPVGPGRGSGVGSIVLYLIGVTDMEPIRFGLFFERFINPERLSYPDIDVDICMDRRGEVVDYMLKKYGSDNVAQIITFGKMKAKMVVKDVGRVLNVPLVKVNHIAKLIPDELNITLDKALEIDADLAALYEKDEEVREILDVGRSLEGSVRNTSIHAAGVIVCGDPIMEHIPICVAKDSDINATQYSMKPVEAVGMLKIDFLGLKTLTSIQKAVDALKKDRDIGVDWMNLPLDNEKTFSIINQGKTMGIFQVESGGMQELAMGLHVDTFEEIMAVIALYRPGPMDMIPSFINRKHGREKIENDHPLMQKILAETYGVMVYQEQVMQIASKLANFSLAEGDVLRKAMGKKDLEEMAKQRDKFVGGCAQNGIDEEIAITIFDKIERFASYGFNKSHAAAYAYISYVTAYLKANYPKEWMAALMTSDFGDIAKVSEFIRECCSMGVAILPPDINESSNYFRATDDGIRFAMSAIKGIGMGVVESIVNEREKNGRFEDLYDFIRRISSKKIGRKITEVLIDAGCFDYTKWSRDAMRESIDTMYDMVLQQQREEERGIVDFFSEMESSEDKKFTDPPVEKEKTPKIKMLMREKELLGFFLKGHPLDDFKDKIEKLSCVSLDEVEKLEHNTVFRAVAVIDTVKVKITNKGQRKFAVLTISSGSKQYELLIWPDLFESKGAFLVENQLIYTVIHLEKGEGNVKCSCCWFDNFDNIDKNMVNACEEAYDSAKITVEKQAKRKKGKFKKNGTNGEKVELKTLNILLDADKTKLSHILELKKIFSENAGNHKVNLEFFSGNDAIGLVSIDGHLGKIDISKVGDEIKHLSPVLELKKL